MTDRPPVTGMVEPATSFVAATDPATFSSDRWFASLPSAMVRLLDGSRPVIPPCRPRDPRDQAILTHFLSIDQPLLFDLAGDERVNFTLDLIHEILRNDERVLIITSPTRADQLTTQLSEHHDQLLIRIDDPTHLPAALQRHATQLHDRLRHVVTGQIESVSQQHASFQAAEATLTQMRAIAGRMGQLAHDEDVIRRERDAVATVVASHPVVVEETVTSRIAALEAERQRLQEPLPQSHGAARPTGGLFRRLSDALFAKSNGATAVLAPHESPVDRLPQIERELQELRDQLSLAHEQAIKAEADRRRADCDRRLAELSQQHDEVDRQFRAGVEALQRLELGALTPSDHDGMTEMAARIRTRIDALSQDLSRLQHDLTRIDAERTMLHDRAVAQVRIVVLVSLESRAFVCEFPVSRTIVTDADDWTPGELGRLASRTLLLGSREMNRSSGFLDLWQSLPTIAPIDEQGRSVIRLQPLVARGDLHREPLADRPEIELRLADGDLVEIAFPSTMTFAQIKAFLAWELDVIVIETLGPAHWHDQPERMMACWPGVERDLAQGEWIDLGAGIREKVSCDGPQPTAALSFDRSAGWTTESAQQWLADHAQPARTVAVTWPATSAEPLATSRLVASYD